MQIIFTGGHHNSALVVAILLKQRGHDIVWYGHKHSTKNKSYISEEYKEVTQAGIPFIELDSGKIHGGNPASWLKFFKAIGFCTWKFIKRRPQLVVAFGGYLAVPAVIAAWILRIKAVSHEQTTTIGMANKVMLPFLHTLFLTWEDTQSLVPQAKTHLVGLPIPAQPPQPLSQQELQSYFDHPTKPLIVISGGKQGAHAINMLVKDTLTFLLPSYNIYHQAGNNPEFDDLKHLKAHCLTLPLEYQQSYHVVGYTQNFNRLVASANILIGRSGAHTIYDVIRMKKKMLAIPLPFSYNDEQRKNALKLEALGLGKILEQEQATANQLVAEINNLKLQNVNPTQVQTYIDTHMPSDAAARMADQIERLIQ